MAKPAIAPPPKAPFPREDSWFGLVWLPVKPIEAVSLLVSVELKFLEIEEVEVGAESVKITGANEGLKSPLLSIGEFDGASRMSKDVGKIVGASVKGMKKLMEKLMRLSKPPNSDSFHLCTSKMRQNGVSGACLESCPSKHNEKSRRRPTSPKATALTRKLTFWRFRPATSGLAQLP